MTKEQAEALWFSIIGCIEAAYAGGIAECGLEHRVAQTALEMRIQQVRLAMSKAGWTPRLTRIPGSWDQVAIGCQEIGDRSLWDVAPASVEDKP